MANTDKISGFSPTEFAKTGKTFESDSDALFNTIYDALQVQYLQELFTSWGSKDAILYYTKFCDKVNTDLIIGLQKSLNSIVSAFNLCAANNVSNEQYTPMSEVHVPKKLTPNGSQDNLNGYKGIYINDVLELNNKLQNTLLEQIKGSWKSLADHVKLQEAFVDSNDSIKNSLENTERFLTSEFNRVFEEMVALCNQYLSQLTDDYKKWTSKTAEAVSPASGK